MATHLSRGARATLVAVLALVAGLAAAPGPARAAGGPGLPPGVSAGDRATVGVDVDKAAPPQSTSKVAARTAGAAAAATDCPDNCYFYGLGRQETANTGAYATSWVSKPAVDAADYHSLGELAVQSSLNGPNRQIVEVGWSVDPGVNRDEEPHLFVYHWVNGKESCYNGCGFVAASDVTVKAGQILTPDSSMRFGIQYFDGNWWVMYNDVWFGYFPDSLWAEEGVTFTSAGAYQAFGEVAASTEKPCTDMGTGTLATSKGTRGYWSGAIYYDTTGAATAASLYTGTSPSVEGYAVRPVGKAAFFFGGPGFC